MSAASEALAVFSMAWARSWSSVLPMSAAFCFLRCLGPTLSLLCITS
eukprot:CAMPEP_0206004124 /NCGR_PEP_ID=MMETSP1464-20131121/3791_1 /ASSEMBLY_ACC=CAM_ASM_001124 /TAXON_ID=119497 /ORGANISM="Exanthemachrysis gayraliae, Strain RCC1523" /LENGTH=46 /DNA_ID= /DNA_START= /DNA_END= /DNA_ORIENTATION=